MVTVEAVVGGACIFALFGGACVFALWEVIQHFVPRLAPMCDVGKCKVCVHMDDGQTYTRVFVGDDVWTAVNYAHEFIAGTKPILMNDVYVPRRRVFDYTIVDEEPFVVRANDVH